MLVPATAFLVAAIVAPLPPKPVVVRQVLPSGVHLLVSPRPNACLVAIEIRVRGAGSAHETADENGLAHAVEHLLFKRTDLPSPESFDARFEHMGGEGSAQTLRDGTAFRVCVFPDRWKDALATWGELLQKPAFREADWATERTVILSEMDVARSETAKLGLQTLAATTYPASDPYSQPLMGPRANVERFTASDLRAFHAKRYRAENLTIAVSGPVTVEEAAAAVNELWSGVGAGVSPPAPDSGGAGSGEVPAPVAPDLVSPLAPPESGAGGLPETLDSPTRAPLFTDGEQTARKLATVYLGFRAPRLQTEPDSAAACDVLGTMLARGSGGIIGDRLAGDRKLVTISVNAEYVPQTDRALFILQATGEKRDIGRIEDVIVADLADLQTRFANGDAVLDDLLEGAKAAAVGEVRYQRETVDGEAKYLAYLDMLDAPPDYAEKYAARVQAVTVADIARLLDRHVTPAKRTVAVIGLSAIVTPANVPGATETEAAQ